MEKNIITVSGDGVVKVDPDQATITIGVQATDRVAKSAQNSVNKTATAIRDAALKIVVDRKDIQTTNLSLYPQFNDSRKITQYVASNQITITVNDIERVGDVIDAAMAAGATNIGGIQFGIKDPKQHRAEALKRAVADARSKAEPIAAALGKPILEVIQVDESDAPMQYMKFMGGGGGSAMAMESAPVEAGQLDVQAGVTVRFKFAP